MIATQSSSSNGYEHCCLQLSIRVLIFVLAINVCRSRSERYARFPVTCTIVRTSLTRPTKNLSTGQEDWATPQPPAGSAERNMGWMICCSLGGVNYSWLKMGADRADCSAGENDGLMTAHWTIPTHDPATCFQAQQRAKASNFVQEPVTRVLLREQRLQVACK